jgi:hypothetical protein
MIYSIDRLTKTCKIRHINMKLKNPFVISPVEAYTLEDYVKLPLSERQTAFLKLYRDPAGLLLQFDSVNSRFICESDRFDAFFKKTYPIQFFFRETVSDFLNKFFKYPLNKLSDKIKYFLNPRQKWLTKQIPKSWRDKCTLIPDLVFACLIHFVEVENGIEHSTWEYSENVKDDLVKAYRYAKHIRARLEKLTWSVPYERCRYYEKLYDRLETHYLMKIIEHRDYLWT